MRCKQQENHKTKCTTDVQMVAKRKKAALWSNMKSHKHTTQQAGKKQATEQPQKIKGRVVFVHP